MAYFYPTNPRINGDIFLEHKKVILSCRGKSWKVWLLPVCLRLIAPALLGFLVIYFAIFQLSDNGIIKTRASVVSANENPIQYWGLILSFCCAGGIFLIPSFLFIKEVFKKLFRMKNLFDSGGLN